MEEGEEVVVDGCWGGGETTAAVVCHQRVDSGSA